MKRRIKYGTAALPGTEGHRGALGNRNWKYSKLGINYLKVQAGGAVGFKPARGGKESRRSGMIEREKGEKSGKSKGKRSRTIKLGGSAL